MSTTSIDFKSMNEAAAAASFSTNNTIANLTALEKEHGPLTESVTHILANIADTIEQHKQFKIMHADSLSAFLAGVEVLSRALPVATDATKIANTLRVLSVIGTKDGVITTKAAPIAKLGASKEDIHDKYRVAVRRYLSSIAAGEPHTQELLSAVKRLQVQIDRAVTAAAHAHSSEFA